MRYCSPLRSVASILFLFCVGCALPTPGRESAVPAKDIVVTRLLGTAEKQLNASRYADAELTYAQIAYLKSDLPSIRVGLIRAHIGLGLYDDAISTASELMQEFPTEEKFQSLYAEALAASGKRKEAIAMWRTLIKGALLLNRTDEAADYLRNISESLFILGREEEAFCASEEAFAFRSTSRDELLRHARLAYATNNIKRFEAALNGFIASPGIPADPVFYLIRSYLQFSQGRIEQALSSLRTAREFEGAPMAVSSEIDFFDSMLRYRLFPESSEFRQSLYDSMSGGRLSASQTLFWPPKMVLEVESISREIK